MKDFFGTVIEPGDAVVVAVPDGEYDGKLEMAHVESVMDECRCTLVDHTRPWFAADEVISMKSIASSARKD